MLVNFFGTTMGYPTIWNNKKLVLFDDLICNIDNGNLCNDYEFRLYECDSNGNIVEVCYEGVWFIVDNGYDLSWSCTIPPIKDDTSFESIRFSEWL